LKYILLISLSVLLFADKVTTRTLACPSQQQLNSASLEITEDSMNLSMYAIANGCEIIFPGDKIEVIDYDIKKEKEKFHKILYKRTDSYLFVRSSSIFIEQSGSKNKFSF